MKYTREKWENRLLSRSDLSMYLTHLTRGTDIMNALEVLLKILNEKNLKSTCDTGFINGNKSVVCFQDIPFNSIAENVKYEQENINNLGNKIRYLAIGIAFDKSMIFKSGGRPVVYEKTNVAKNILPSDEYWRIVNLDFSDDKAYIDWTHEREWRILGDFNFELKDVFVLLPNSQVYKAFIKECNSKIIKEIAGIVVLSTLIK